MGASVYRLRHRPHSNRPIISATVLTLITIIETVSNMTTIAMWGIGIVPCFFSVTRINIILKTFRLTYDFPVRMRGYNI